jgi:hypothetical protein
MTKTARRAFIVLMALFSAAWAQPEGSQAINPLTMENYFSYSPVAHDIVAHVLTLGYAAMIAGLVYFLATSQRSSPQYRLSSTLSAVVMASAFFELYQQFQVWDNAFVFNGEVWERGDTAFSNGYRYMNWTIDVPILLTQLLIVLGYTGLRFRRLWVQFVIAGLLMVPRLLGGSPLETKKRR